MPDGRAPGGTLQAADIRAGRVLRPAPTFERCSARSSSCWGWGVSGGCRQPPRPTDSGPTAVEPRLRRDTFPVSSRLSQESQVDCRAAAVQTMNHKVDRPAATAPLKVIVELQTTNSDHRTSPTPARPVRRIPPITQQRRNLVKRPGSHIISQPPQRPIPYSRHPPSSP